MNKPYVDDRLFHFGFQLGVNFSSFFVTDSEVPIADPITGQTEIYHSRVSSLLPGFNVGFVTDLRLCNYLSLRFCPGMQFASRSLTYKTESGRPVAGSPGHGATVDVLAMPVSLPLYLKWTAAREGNYRPYVIAGGGVSFNVSRDREKPVVMNLIDYSARSVLASICISSGLSSVRKSRTASVLPTNSTLRTDVWNSLRKMRSTPMPSNG